MIDNVKILKEKYSIIGVKWVCACMLYEWMSAWLFMFMSVWYSRYYFYWIINVWTFPSDNLNLECVWCVRTNGCGGCDFDCINFKRFQLIFIIYISNAMMPVYKHTEGKLIERMVETASLHRYMKLLYFEWIT